MIRLEEEEDEEKMMEESKKLERLYKIRKKKLILVKKV